MRKIFTRLLPLFVLITTGCGNDPVKDRIWCGELYRTADNERLSEVCLKLSNDTLRIYSNAIFGLDNECLLCQQHKQNDYRFVNSSGVDFFMQIIHSQEQESETLRIEGPDYRIALHPVADKTDFTPDLLAFYRQRSVPSQAALYFSGRWSGKIVRTRDNQKLSPVCVEYGFDTIKVYANAIFGKTNEELLYKKFENGNFIYANATDEEFSLRPTVQDANITLTGSDFVMELTPLEGDWEKARAFYKRRVVPRDANGYMFGTYYGKTLAYSPKANMAGLLMGAGTGLMDMQASITLTFLENNQCKQAMEIMFLNSDMQLMTVLFGGPTHKTSIHNYRVEGNKIILDKKGGTFYIRPDGSLLMKGEGDATIKFNEFILKRQ